MLAAAAPAVNSAQRLAITHPCRLAVETMHPRFRTQTGRWSLVLTVNTGYE